LSCSHDEDALNGPDIHIRVSRIEAPNAEEHGNGNTLPWPLSIDFHDLFSILVRPSTHSFLFYPSTLPEDPRFFFVSLFQNAEKELRKASGHRHLPGSEMTTLLLTCVQDNLPVFKVHIGPRQAIDLPILAMVSLMAHR